MFVYTERQYASLHLQEVQLSVDALTSNLRAAWQTQSFSLPCCFKVDHGAACWGQAGDAQGKKKKKRAEMQSQGSGFECGHSFGGTMHHGGLVLLVLLKCHSNTADN